ncbi:AAA family ATPase [Parapedobacter koreensis]|uniref:Predicted ATPase, AAA+ ATPase superfamily n=1 Tax=Parapedobacter koreensis TaxID=332977 RepID=A0A1H7EUL2_9SPHI|nr:AAA family ATPase [Parapedobacter koreensis]SEK17596.1 Predicted ATPase, AAA+ ATPase superfamily [Parapedobacter koreensis]
MKNSLGNPARGDAFYPRGVEVRKIYRVLGKGTSIYLSAPRRVGKTSILKYIEEFPEDGYYFIYVITESVDSENEFFKVIFEELVRSEAIGRLSKLYDAIKGGFEAVLGKVKKVYNIEFRETGETDYHQILVDLFGHLKPEYGHVVVLIDEFPQTIQNILNKDGAQAAEHFIQRNRELRHHRNVIDKVHFIYTGSMSLYPMVEKVTALTAVNDLRTVEVAPLSYGEALDFITKLLGTDDVVVEEEILKYTLDKMRWLIPFHLQLIAQEIVEVYETTGNKVDREAVDQAFDQIVHSRNKPQFEPYFARLATLFKGGEHAFVFEVLEYIAENDNIDHDVLNDKRVKHHVEEVKRIMDILEGDGYLFKGEGHIYRYTSPILQLWCRKHICK